MPSISPLSQTLSELPEADLTIKKRPAAEDAAAAAEACGNKASDDSEDGSGSTEHDYAFNLAPPVGQWVDLKNGIRCVRVTAGPCVCASRALCRI